ncbi:hypothetical protein QAD02_020552 [Eretmocerus hayati]|uniref:Uncharacterized protein n=1 Tax=Eretmocerus hayati TaxID=131215 RepID=A0ACC2PME6_9HYME|nr:hypothetical protein QAD02_020552 [Eretmocerus hayati]
MDKMKPTTYCHDIIGKIVSVEKKNCNGKDVMNFVMQIQDGSGWPMTAWEKDVARLDDIIIPGDVIHIDGIYVKTPGDPRYSMEKHIGFTVQTSSIITNLSKVYQKNITLEKSQALETIKIYDDIQECLNSCEDSDITVGLLAYVKSTFVQGNPGIKTRIGALSDKKIKITTSIKNYDNTQITFEPGQKLQIYGHFIDYEGKIALEINNLNDIKIIDDHDICPIDTLRRVVKTPQKKK